MLVLRKLVMVVSVVIIAGTSNDNPKPAKLLLRVYIASALADGASPQPNQVDLICKTLIGPLARVDTL
jgi:hypothetical protein